MAKNDELLSKQQAEVDNKLWAMADELRGNMDASEFKNYILGLIFYKFLSDKIIKTINDELKDDDLDFYTAWNDESLRKDIEKMSINVLGYFLNPKFFFESFISKIKKDEFSVEDLKEGIHALVESTTNTSEKEDETEDEKRAREARAAAFNDLFDDMDLDDNKLGKGESERSKLIGKIILKINDLNLDINETNFDILGHAYEFLIGKFAASAGKKAGEFYTPAQVSELLARIVTIENKNIKSVYDPTCGSGSLLLRVRNNVANPQGLKIYGQEMVTTTYNLARMNMLLHGVDYEKFDIANDDTLERPSEKHSHLKFEAVVANPPYSANWDPDGKDEDSRFNGYDGEYAPKSKADFAFLQHMIFHLNENGTLAVVLPHGVLFRGASEGQIRRKIVKDYNLIDAVIGLPANLFFGTAIPTCILVLKKCRRHSNDVLFIDASSYFEKGKKQNYLRVEDIERILDAYKERSSVQHFSYLATLEEIKNNDYNLNIPRYVKVEEETVSLDISSTINDIKELEKKREELDLRIEKALMELKNNE